MRGLHLTADLGGCAPDSPWMTDAAALAAGCRAAVVQVGLQAVGELFHAFAPAGSGITGVMLLAESHLAVHTWPELGTVTLDVFVCNRRADNRSRAQRLIDSIVRGFAPSIVQLQRLERNAGLTRNAAATARPARSPSSKASSKTE